MVLQLEQCVADTDGQLAKTFEFLGLSKYAAVSSRTRRSPAASLRPA